MPNLESSKKRVRQNIKHRARNRWRKTNMRDAIKHFDERLLHGSIEEARDAYRQACKLLDKTAGKGVIHPNQAARRKSRMNDRLRKKASA